MNNFSYENQGTNTYLVYSISQNDVVDSMSLGMLTNNKIHGLATTLFMQMDSNKFIKYNVSSRISVKQFFSGAVNKKRLLGVFKGIVNALLSAEDYMIDERSIILDLDYIYADVSTCDTVLICLPIEDNEEQHDLGAFFKGIMFGTQFDQTENCDHVARIINYLNSTPMFSLTDFRDLIEQIENAGSSTTQPVATVVKPASQQPTVTPAANTTAVSGSANNAVVQPTTSSANQTQTAQRSGVPNGPLKVTPPPATPANPVAQQPNVGTVPAEKQISMFGLLMHYSKENAELYKAQKAAKKNVGKTPSATPAKPQQKPQQKPQSTNSGFAIPGQNNNPGFAVPGQIVNQPATQVQKPVQQAQQPATTNTPTQQQTQVAQQPTFVPRQVPQGQSANFGETTVLGGGAVGETTVLTAAQNPNKVIAPHLIRKKNNEKISLNKPVFRVGKERSYVDYFIGDNTAISRSHANFITREGVYFVVDTNSTNHTFVNGTMINSNEEVQINHGDTIRLANEDFDFKLY